MLLGANLLLTSNAHTNKTIQEIICFKSLFTILLYSKQLSMEHIFPRPVLPPHFSFICSLSLNSILLPKQYAPTQGQQNMNEKKIGKSPLRTVNKQQFSENFLSIQISTGKTLKHSTNRTAQHILTHTHIVFCKSHLIYC